MDKIQFQCSGCGKGLSAPADRAGKTGNCPGCGTAITIPAPASQAEQTQGADKIKFACSQCSKVVNATPDKAGKTAKCPACGSTLQIPQTRDYYKQSLVAAADALLKSMELRSQGEGQQALMCVMAAEQAAREVLASPCLPWLPPGYEVTALNLLGDCGWQVMDDRYEPSALKVLGDSCDRGGRLTEAQAALEKALVFGRSKGYTDQEVGIANALCSIYALAVLREASGDHLDKAAAIASKMDDLVRCHKQAEGFESQEHGSALLMANAMIDAMTAEQQCDYDNALALYNNLLESPYMKCSGSGTTLRWLVWTAYMRIGRILFLYQWRVRDAIPYLQNAVRYSEKDDAQLQEARSLLEDAMSQPPIPPQLKSTLDAVRSGDNTARHKAFQELQGGVPRQYFRAVQSAVFQAMREGDNVVQSRGALVLATMGDASAFTVKRLLLNLTPPPSENELAYKSEALFGLSHIKNGSDIIVKEILGVAQHDKDAVARERAVFALAVIGDNGAREFVRRLAVAGNDAALFAMEWLGKDAEWLRSAVLCGREKLPGAAMSAFACGWNGLLWGASVADFRRRFPGAFCDGNKWRTGEGEEELTGTGIRMLTGYMFNRKGQFELVGFEDAPGEGDGQVLFQVFGDPDGKVGTSWSYGPVILKWSSVIVLLNTAFSDDPRAYEGWTGRERDPEMWELWSGRWRRT